jgi:hypothetical protein
VLSIDLFAIITFWLCVKLKTCIDHGGVYCCYYYYYYYYYCRVEIKEKKNNFFDFDEFLVQMLWSTPSRKFNRGKPLKHARPWTNLFRRKGGKHYAPKTKQSNQNYKLEKFRIN